MGRNTEALTKLAEGEEVPDIEVPPRLALHLGCGRDLKPNFVNVDCVAGPGVDVVHDLNVAPWPWADSTVTEIDSSHTLEHCDFVTFMNECWRILRPGAKASIRVPHGRNDRAWQDPSHRRPYTEANFAYVQKEWREANGLDHYLGLVCDFAPIDYGVIWADPVWEQKSQEARDFALRHYWNVAADLVVFLTAKK